MLNPPEKIRRDLESRGVIVTRPDGLDPESNLAKFFDALARGDKPECLRLLVQEYLSIPERHRRRRVLSQPGAKAIAGFTRK
jgi:glutathione synthase/RimK-type ligase-like ATP-grasp enzyme